MSIRLRVALLSVGLMAILLVAIGVGVYFSLQHSLTTETRNRLFNVYKGVASEITLTFGPEGPKYKAPDLDPFASPGLYVQVKQNDGSLVTSSNDLQGHSLNVPSRVNNANGQGSRVYYSSTHRSSNGTSVPILVLSAPLINSDGVVIGTVQVAEPLGPMDETLGRLRDLLAAGGALGLIATALVAYWLAGRSLNPLTRITRTARQIGHEGDLSQRIDPPATRDEVQQLAETFNEMLGRLEETFAAERRFVSDASHELRTPLTALRANADILLRQLELGRPDPADLSEGLVDIRDEAERMGRLVHYLLTLARADVGWRPELELVHLDQVVADVVRVAQPLAGEHSFVTSIDDEVDVMGSSDQLKQLLLILLDNAFTYTPESGRIDLSVHRQGEQARIVVADNGPGIPPEQLERIFDRFYRGEVAREHGTSGAGLGLAIARWIVDCHNGTIQADSGVGQGTRIAVQIPLAVASDAAQRDHAPSRPAREPAITVSGD